MDYIIYLQSQNKPWNSNPGNGVPELLFSLQRSCSMSILNRPSPRIWPLPTTALLESNYHISLPIFCFHPYPCYQVYSQPICQRYIRSLLWLKLLRLLPNLSRVKTEVLSLTCETLLILHSTTSELSNPISYRSPSFSLFLEHIRHPTSGLLHLPFPLPGLLLLPISTWLTPSHSVGLDLTVTFLLRPSLSPLLQIAKQPQTHFTHKYKHTGVYDSYAPSLVYFSPGSHYCLTSHILLICVSPWIYNFLKRGNYMYFIHCHYPKYLK